MTVLNQLASAQNHRDEVPNQLLAQQLAETEDTQGIQEIAKNLWNKKPAIQADCIKVLYEIGYLNPALIAPYTDDFLKLLKNRNNRLVWGGMTALSIVASIQADRLFLRLDELQKAIANGSVITVDAGVLTLTKIAAAEPEYNHTIFPYLLDHLRTCRPKDVPQHAEKILLAVTAENQTEFITVIEDRLSNATSSQLTRLKRVIKQAQAI